jgi:hypothetical protein
MDTHTRARYGGLVVGLVCGVSLAVALGSSPAMGAANLAGKVTKALKLAKKANKKADAALTASKQPGPPGPAGPAGSTGPSGPSNGYASPPVSSVAWTFSQQTLASVPVQAGSYILDSYVVADNNGVGAIQASCWLRLAGASVTNTTLVRLAPNGPGDSDAIALTTGGTATVAGTAELRCTSLSSLGEWRDPMITAIKVGSLN